MLGTVLLQAVPQTGPPPFPWLLCPGLEKSGEKSLLYQQHRCGEYLTPEPPSLTKILIKNRVGSVLLIVLTGTLSVFHCTGHADPREENVQRVVFFSPDPIPQQENLNTLP